MINSTAKNNLDGELSAIIGDDDTQALGLGVIVFKDGREVYSYFGGQRHIDPDKKMTRKTLLRAASLSKMFTVFSIMQLVEQGKLNLSDDVSNYLGFELRNPNFPDTPITIEMLACHTSSLRDGKIYSLPPHCSLKEFFTAGGVAYEDGKHFANTKPGKYFCYCNLNYGILGTIIEHLTSERFDLYQKNHILKQLDISGGYVVGNFNKKIFNELGTLYRKENGKWTVTLDNYKTPPRKDFITVQNPYAPDAYGSYDLSGYRIGTNATIFAPQGGLRLSFDDLSKALQMLMNRGELKGKRIISEESFDALINSHWTFDGTNADTCGGVMENYGLGTYRIDGMSKARLCKDFEIDLVGHSGEAFGIISGLYFIPNTQDGVIFMINGATLKEGNFSAGYLSEEQVMNPVCKNIFGSG